MSYKKYSKRLIHLEEQNREFAAKEAPIKGYLRIETGNNKGAVRCYVENLKFFQKGTYLYKLVLFGEKNGAIISAILGTLNCNAQGKGESYFRFLPNDVDGNGNEYNDFETAIIVAASAVDKQESLHPVMKGELVIGSNSGEERKQEKKENKLNEVWEEKKQSDHKGIFPEENKDLETEDNKEFPGINQQKSYNHFYNKFILHACNHICQTAEKYQDIEPFIKDQTEAAWKKMPISINLPLIAPGAHYFSGRYKHYIFGAKERRNQEGIDYYFGIPGRNIPEEQPDGGESGFVFWQPIKGSEENKGNHSKENLQIYGYWILKVDGITGNIIDV